MLDPTPSKCQDHHGSVRAVTVRLSQPRSKPCTTLSDPAGSSWRAASQPSGRWVEPESERDGQRPRATSDTKDGASSPKSCPGHKTEPVAPRAEHHQGMQKNGATPTALARPARHRTERRQPPLPPQTQAGAAAAAPPAQRAWRSEQCVRLRLHAALFSGLAPWWRSAR